MVHAFEAPIFNGYPLVYGVLTEESLLEKQLSSPFAWCKQVHSDSFIEVNKEGRYIGFDGLITTKRHLPLVIRHADCQALVLYDKKHHIVANIHAGWRGLKAQIYSRAIHHLKEQHGTSPKELLAAISPSLSQEKSEYVDGKTLFPNRFQPFENEYHYDLKAIALMELLSCGVLQENIAISTLCTASDLRFHSWRRDKTEKRNVTFCYLL